MPPRRTGFNEYMPQGQRTHDLEHERLLRAGWAVHAGVGLFNQKGNKFMYGNLTAGGFFDSGWGASSLEIVGFHDARAPRPAPRLLDERLVVESGSKHSGRRAHRLGAGHSSVVQMSTSPRVIQPPA